MGELTAGSAQSLFGACELVVSGAKIEEPVRRSVGYLEWG